MIPFILFRPFHLISIMLAQRCSPVTVGNRNRPFYVMKLMNSKFVRKYQNFNLIRFFRIVWTVIMRPITFVCPSPLDPPP
jgi:hypothetical protein